MNLNYITTDVLADLEANYQNYKEHYVSLDKEWFNQYFEATGGLQPSKIEIPDNFSFDMTSSDDDFNASDLENIKRVYTNFYHLTPVQAADERLWSGLAHSQFWDYIVFRRGNLIRSGDDAKIRNSFFYVYGSRRSSNVNTLARLWWAGYLTYDEANKENPFELTELICRGAFASTLLILSSSKLTANKNLILGLLDSIKKRSDAGEEIKRKSHIELPTKYLNRMGSATILDYLSREKVMSIIDNLFERKLGKL